LGTKISPEDKKSNFLFTIHNSRYAGSGSSRLQDFLLSVPFFFSACMLLMGGDVVRMEGVCAKVIAIYAGNLINKASKKRVNRFGFFLKGNPPMIHQKNLITNTYFL